MNRKQALLAFLFLLGINGRSKNCPGSDFYDGHRKSYLTCDFFRHILFCSWKFCSGKLKVFINLPAVAPCLAALRGQSDCVQTENVWGFQMSKQVRTACLSCSMVTYNEHKTPGSHHWGNYNRLGKCQICFTVSFSVNTVVQGTFCRSGTSKGQQFVGIVFIFWNCAICRLHDFSERRKQLHSQGNSINGMTYLSWLSSNSEILEMIKTCLYILAYLSVQAGLNLS